MICGVCIGTSRFHGDYYSCFTFVCPMNIFVSFFSDKYSDSSTTSCLPNTCMTHEIEVQNFVTFFSATSLQRNLKFGFRVYISQLYRVMRFHIYNSTTSCFLNTCIILHMIAKLKTFFTFLLNCCISISEIWFQCLY